MSVYLTYSESRRGGEICKGEENDEWPSHEDEHVEWYLTGAVLKRPSWCYETIGGDYRVGDKLHVVVVRYFDGGTFGRTCGLWHIAGVYMDESEAVARKEKIYGNLKQSISYDPKDEWEPWKSYFAGFEGCDVFDLMVAEEQL